MEVRKERMLTNKDIINFNDFNNKIIRIDDEVEEITLTSYGKKCNGGVLVKKRNSSLKIIVEDLNLNSSNEITFDFRSKSEGDYKNIIEFKGNNILESTSNFCICISNNQIVEIQGESNANLEIIGGNEKPAIGNGEYIKGSGQLIFSKLGSVIVRGGAGYRKEIGKSYLGKAGAAAINFLQENNHDVSKVEILDNINIKIYGGDGDGGSTITTDKCCGCGGSAIQIDKEAIIRKKGGGYLYLIGGAGGECIGEYRCGNCGDGGNAIDIEGGLVEVHGPAVLKGGCGGSINKSHKNVISKGGDGGQCIYIEESEGIEFSTDTKIIIENFVECIGGDGGNSGIIIENNIICGDKGGNGGGVIKASNKNVEAIIGEIIFMEGQGGNGGEHSIIGMNGADGKRFDGDNIIIKNFNDEIENVNAEQLNEYLLNDEELISAKETYDIKNNKEEDEDVIGYINNNLLDKKVDIREVQEVGAIESMEEEKSGVENIEVLDKVEEVQAEMENIEEAQSVEQIEECIVIQKQDVENKLKKSEDNGKKSNKILKYLISLIK